MGRKKELSQMKIFENVESKTLDKILKCASILEVPKGTFLIRAREKTSFVFFQLSGKSVIYNLTSSGKRKIIFVLGKGALLNENVLNSEGPAMYCESIERSAVLAVPAADFLRILSEDFELTKNVLRCQELKMWRLSHQLKNTMSSILLERKLASKLWKLARDFGIPTEEGVEINLNLTITFLADMLGVPRETTSRACTVLVEQGLIKMNRKRITIVDTGKIVHFFRTGSVV